MIKIIYKGIIGLLIGGTASYGGITIADTQINPYTDKIDRMELSLIQDIPESGESKIELLKDRPKMVLSKWDDEIRLGVSYSKVKGQGDRNLLSNKIEWKDAKEEVHAYPIDNKNFEFEIVLKEKPDTNVFDFTIDGYENLDFFYQPTLTQQEIDEGVDRPENVVGSYAVYHKTKKNHRVGDTNYATGKAFHIYRPKVIDSNGLEQWAELNYETGILRVTVSQNFLDNAIYPVRVDPTFGDTDGGASCDGSFIHSVTSVTAVAGNVTEIVSKIDAVSGSHTIEVGLWTDNASYPDSLLINGASVAVPNRVSVACDNATYTSSTVSPSVGVSAGTVWFGPALDVNTENTGEITFDASTPVNSYEYTAAGQPSYNGSGPENPFAAGATLRSGRRFSIYATYTVSGAPSITSDLILFE